MEKSYEKNNRLKIVDILKMNDEEFINDINERSSFIFKGQKRRFKYRTTNECSKKLLNFLSIKRGDSVLAVSSSGVNLFEMLSDEKKIPKIVLGFDYSLKQVAYNLLLKSAIRLLTFKEFNNYFYLNNKNKNNIRKKIFIQMPKSLKLVLINQHEFRKRDLFFNSYNNIKWLKEEKKFNCVKKNIEKIKFFHYEISHLNINLSHLFEKKSFNIIYLSNILDWLCWHNKDIKNYLPILNICRDANKILKRGGNISGVNLVNRGSYVVDLLNRVKVLEKENYRIFKYNWLNYKINVKQ